MILKKKIYFLQVGLGHHPPPPYRGGGRRGGRGPAFQGRGHGGRGRGRGRGGRHGPPSSPQPPEGGEKIAWCELCRVDCTSKEILETHKNGKRHQKNLQMKETEKDETEAADDDKGKKQWMKRKAKGGGGGGGGGGGKRQRQQGRVVIPLMCDLCNVKCDTQEVFDRHVGGKKHIAKLKRFQGHQALYGPTAVQALYPPNPLSQSLGPPPNPQLADAPLQFAQSTTGLQ